MEIKLIAEEKLALEQQHKQERDRLVCDRIKAVLLRSESWSITHIAQALRLHNDTVYRHIEEYVRDKKLHHDSGGSESKLNDQQTEELIAHLENVMYVKVADICAYVKNTYQISYTIAGMTWWLQHHKFVYKKPKKVPAKADEGKQLDFIKTYEELKANTPANEPILFIDSVHPTMETRVASGWIRKGKEKQIQTTASRTRLNITGAIELTTLNVEHKVYETINGATTIDFLQSLKDAYKDAPSIHIILDQSGYHRSEEVAKYAEENSIKLHFLPPYSPNLNPIERLWKVMNEYTRNNVFFPSAKKFKESVLGFFTDTLPEIKSTLSTRITDNFQVIIPANSP